MSPGLFPDPVDQELAIEPDAIAVAVEPELELAIEPAPTDVVAIAPAALAPPAAIMEVLPADFRLPALIQFIPNAALRIAVDEAAAYALSVVVDGHEGLQRADRALSAVRATLTALDDHFEEPTAIAYALHKRLTSVRGEWQAPGQKAVEVVGRSIYTENKRLEALALEQRRKDQAEADRQVREAAQREAEAAEKASAPAPVVQELKRQAETATAPPVTTATAAPVMRGTSTVAIWKARIIGTPGEAEPNPAIEAITPKQRAFVFDLLHAILDGKAPLAAIELNWSYLNKRAKADMQTLAIAGIEAFDQGGVRAKGTRTR